MQCRCDHRHRRHHHRPRVRSCGSGDSMRIVKPFTRASDKLSERTVPLSLGCRMSVRTLRVLTTSLARLGSPSIMANIPLSRERATKRPCGRECGSMSTQRHRCSTHCDSLGRMTLCLGRATTKNQHHHHRQNHHHHHHEGIWGLLDTVTWKARPWSPPDSDWIKADVLSDPVTLFFGCEYGSRPG